MVICAVPKCPSRSDRNYRNSSDGSIVTFHRFPKESSRLDTWLLAIRRSSNENPNLIWKPKRHSVICSRHFTESDFKAGLKIKFLVPSAIPSIFPEYPLPKKQQPKKRRRLLCNLERGLYFQDVTGQDQDVQNKKSKLPLTTSVSQSSLTSYEAANPTNLHKKQDVENKGDNNKCPKSCMDREIINETQEKSELPLTASFSQCPSSEAASPIAHREEKDIENERDNNKSPKNCKDSEIICETKERSELPLNSNFLLCPVNSCESVNPKTHHKEQDSNNKRNKDVVCPKNCTNSELIQKNRKQIKILQQSNKKALKSLKNKQNKLKQLRGKNQLLKLKSTTCNVSGSEKSKTPKCESLLGQLKCSKMKKPCWTETKEGPDLSFTASSLQYPLISCEKLLTQNKEQDIENEGNDIESPESCEVSETNEKSELPFSASLLQYPFTSCVAASIIRHYKEPVIENDGTVLWVCKLDCIDSEKSEMPSFTSFSNRPLTPSEIASPMTNNEEQDINNEEDSNICQNPCKDSRIILRRYRKKIRTLQQRSRRALKSLKIKQDNLLELREENQQLKRKLAQYNISELENAKTRKSEFLLEQLKYFKQEKPHFTEETMKFAILLESNSPKGYEIIRNEDFLSLPSKSTLKRYIGSTSSNFASSSSNRISSEIG